MDCVVVKRVVSNVMYVIIFNGCYGLEGRGGILWGQWQDLLRSLIFCLRISFFGVVTRIIFCCSIVDCEEPCSMDRARWDRARCAYGNDMYDV